MSSNRNMLISVVITTHNRKNIVKRAIKSVLNQIYENIECIVIDDKSTDGTEKIIKNIEDKRVKYIYIPEEESKGGNYARNVGIKVAQGKYIAFLDDDDLWLPEKVLLQLEEFERKPDVKMVYCRRYFCYKEKYCWLDSNDIFVGNVSELVFKRIITSTSTMMFDREALISIGGFDEKLRFWQETELMMRFSQKYLIGYVDKPLIIYTIDASDPNKLSNKYEEWKLAITYIQNKHKDIINNFSEEQLKEWENMICKDAINRCNTKELRMQRKKLYKKVYSYKPSFSMKIKKIFNYQATSKFNLNLRAFMARINFHGGCLIDKIL